MTTKSCAIYKVEGLSEGYKYQVWLYGPAYTEASRSAAEDHPEYGRFITATRTRAGAKRAARTLVHPIVSKPKLVAIIE